jgi:hypothetical protein
LLGVHPEAAEISPATRVISPVAFAGVFVFTEYGVLLAVEWVIVFEALT